jgi:hypothetical protein
LKRTQKPQPRGNFTPLRGGIMKIIFVILLAFPFSIAKAQAPICADLFIPKFSKIATVRNNILEKFEIDKKISNQKEWQLSPEREEQLKNILLSQDKNPENFDDSKLEEFYWALINARLESIPPVSRKLAEYAAKDALNQESWYGRTMGKSLSAFAGPHYNPLFNRVGLPFKRNVNDYSIIDYVLGAHETEHLVHRNTSPKFFIPFLAVSSVEMTMIMKTPFLPLFVRRMETRAISAQWEIAHRIPENIRNLLIEQIRENKISSYKDQEIKTILSSKAFEKATDILVHLKTYWAGDQAKTRLVEIMYDPKAKPTKAEMLAAATTKLNKEDQEFLKSFFEDPTLFITLEDLQTSHEVDSDLMIVARRAVLKNKYGKHSEIYKTVVINTLKNASLSREEFVKQLGPAHGYNLDNIYKVHYRRTGVINYMIYLNTIVFTIASYFDPSQVSHIASLDIRALVELLQYLFMGT